MNLEKYAVLKNIESPDDLKLLSDASKRMLAKEVRAFILQSLSDTGGHLASNLGVVELTIALHSVFDTPIDKIVWDVGHQSYVHKILTGRAAAFEKLRKLDGLSGFPKRTESKYDSFGTGHSSTSISAAMGLATARDLKAQQTGTKSDEKVVAVIGDGSMTGGLAYEGLNNAGRSHTDLLVILNDNQMSIAKNVGAVSRHLNNIRTRSSYLDVKAGIHEALDKLPVIGAPITKGLERVKSAVKNVVVQGVLFEKMGFNYFGPVDGHNIAELENILKQIKNIKGPVLLHVLTKKGKGWKRAEKNPSKFHGVGAFCLETGIVAGTKNSKTYTDVFSEEIVKLASQDSRITAITASMPDGTGLNAFKSLCPKRFFDVGIAEGHAVTFAAGQAAAGLKPFVCIYSSFLQRAYDMIIHDVCIPNLPVTFILDRAGAVAGDGETHQGLYDYAYLMHIPNLVVMAPSGASELRAMLAFAAKHDGPVAIRYPNDAAPDYEFSDFEPYKAQHIVRGEKIAVVSAGHMLTTGIALTERLEEMGRFPSLYNVRFVKPLDQAFIDKLKTYDAVFTIEDACKIGGVGQCIRAAMHGYKGLFQSFAFGDKFIETGTRKQLFERYGLDAANLAVTIDDMLRAD